jgi:UDP-glucuronate 4-epimerase
VTGAAGFIGMHTVLSFLKAGCEVVGVDNLNDYYPIDLKINRLIQCGIFSKVAVGKKARSVTFPNYHFIRQSITNTNAMRALFEAGQFDYVINLAGQAGVRYSLENPQSYVDSNVNGFLSILECCRKFPVKHLIYASSSSVYGLNTSVPFGENDTTDHPMSLYAATKKANEVMAHSYSHLFKIPTTGLRFFTVYGPWGRPDMALFLFTKAILNGEPLKIFNEGKMFRDFTFIDDIVNAITSITFRPPQSRQDWNSDQPESSTSSAPYSIYNIGNSKPSSLLEYVQAIERSLNRIAIKEMCPLQPGDLITTHADVTKLKHFIQYKPLTPIENGVKSFVDWYVQYYHKEADTVRRSA